MSEFLGRWVLVALGVLGALVFCGVAEGLWGGWGPGRVSSAPVEQIVSAVPAVPVVVAALWVGFVNALVRPAFLELCGMRIRGGCLMGVLFGVLAGVNALLFGFLGGWEPALSGVSQGGRLVAMLVALGVAGLGSSVFRSRDGRWHWITYHGRPNEPDVSQSAGGGPEGGDG